MFFINVNYAQCVDAPANSPSNSVFYTISGGSYQSYGCAAVDPSYWLAGTGNSITAHYTVAQDYPKFRVRGMNSDDVASVVVNGIPYPLNVSTARYDPKVICRTFSGTRRSCFYRWKNLAGANSPLDAIILIATFK